MCENYLLENITGYSSNLDNGLFKIAQILVVVINIILILFQLKLQLFSLLLRKLYSRYFRQRLKLIQHNLW